MASTWAKVSIVVMLAAQAYACAAVDFKAISWQATNLKRPKRAGLPHTGRHLAETSSKGWKATLIPTSSVPGTDNSTIIFEKIHRDVEKSKKRARALDWRARNAPYKSSGSKGRKLLDFVADVEYGSGEYSMEISIGTPPQTFVAIADTGSDITWLQCIDCVRCSESKLFDPSVSSTYELVGCTDCDILGNNQLGCTTNCQYTVEYGDQSTTQGDFALETVTLSNTDGTSSTIPEFQFGCATLSDATVEGSDGLVGLGRGPLSFVSQIAPSLNSNKFSYCLLGRVEPDALRSPIIFGESSVPTTLSISYTDILEPYDPSVVPYYYVSLLDISVGGEALSIPATAIQIDAAGNGGTIFDSGSTYTSLDTVAYQLVTSTYESLVDQLYLKADLKDETGFDLCYDLTDVDLSDVRVPSLTFNFEGADFDLPGNNIVVLFKDTIGNLYTCLALTETSGLNIFGNFQQQNFQVVHDLDDLRLGWVETDCATL